MKSLKLIVGLGNPGVRYSETRHNIGFRVIDCLAKTYRIKINKKNTLFQIGKGKINSSDVILAKPLTYVNNSGEAVKKILEDFMIINENLIVVYDDLDLEKGTVRIKTRGGDGGHNGLKSIIKILQYDNFLRIRVGIGRPGTGEDVTNHVLSKFKRSDKKLIEDTLGRAAAAIETILIKGVTNAMNKFNRKI